MNKPAQGFPRAGFYPTILPMKLRTPHNGWRSLYLPPPGLLLMQVRVPGGGLRSKRRKFYDRKLEENPAGFEHECLMELLPLKRKRNTGPIPPRCFRGEGLLVKAAEALSAALPVPGRRDY